MISCDDSSCMNINKLIKSVKFFDHFSNEDVLAIAPFVEVRSYSPGHKVLDHNEVNTSLFFLLDGEVDVFFQHEKIATINKRGELFGELSISAHSSSQAQVKTKSKTQFLVLNFLGVHELEKTRSEHLEKLMYKSFSEVLSERLIKTNKLLKKSA